MCSLLEHVLRLALVNKEECGLHRQESITQIDKYNSLTAIIDAASGQAVFNGCDEEWWRAVSKNIRNKSAHYLLPTILRNCAEDPKLKNKYANMIFQKIMMSGIMIDILLIGEHFIIAMGCIWRRIS